MTTNIVYINLERELKINKFKRGSRKIRINDNVCCCNCFKLLRKSPVTGQDLNSVTNSMIICGSTIARENIKEDITTYQLCSRRCKKKFRKTLYSQVKEKNEKSGQKIPYGFECTGCKTVAPGILRCSGC